jgi:myo-inositol 2-dehydrogenase / D-chiro-inositol 1-dehydrogenase
MKLSSGEKDVMVKIGVIGAGRIGKIHAESIANRVSGATLAAVCDVDAEAAQALGTHYGVPFYTDPQPIFGDPTIEAVAICSSTDTHAPFMIAAAQAGKHIFCEKPISIDLATIDDALEVVNKSGVKFQVGFNRRFDPTFKAAHDAIFSGKVGEPRIVRITSRDPAPPPISYLKVSGGLFLDMTIHDFDMARFLVDSPVVEVYAVGGAMVDPAIATEANDVDTAVVTLRYANGAICTIDNCRATTYGYDQRLDWLGSLGRVTIENHTPHHAVVADEGGIHSAKALHFFLERYMDAYIAEMVEFVHVLNTNGTPSVGGNDGREPVVIGLAAWKSLREGRPVKLSEIDPR